LLVVLKNINLLQILSEHVHVNQLFGNLHLVIAHMLPKFMAPGNNQKHSLFDLGSNNKTDSRMADVAPTLPDRRP